jgi:PEP-CTERM motif
MFNLRKHMIGWAAMALSVIGASPAFAGAATVSLDPSAIMTNTATTFQADTAAITQSNSLITFTGGSGNVGFSEYGVFNVTQFLLGGNVTNTPANPAIPGPNTTVPYVIYGTFTATGTGTLAGSTFTNGVVNTFTFNLYATTSSNGNFVMGTDATNGQPIVTTPASGLSLGSGTLVASILVSADATNGVNLKVNTNFTADAGNAGFFVYPPGFTGVTFLDALTKNVPLDIAACNATEATNPGAVVCTTITGASGTITFTVPEPASLAIFAVGLFGIGFVGMRRRRKV